MPKRKDPFAAAVDTILRALDRLPEGRRIDALTSVRAVLERTIPGMKPEKVTRKSAKRSKDDPVQQRLHEAIQ